MENQTSRTSVAWPERRQRHLNQEATDHFDFVGLPPEVQTIIAGWLCPNCAIAHGKIASTDQAKRMQRDLGSLALCSSHFREVANGHRFHTFVATPGPSFSSPPSRPEDSRDVDIALAHRYNSKAFVELLERLLNYGQLRENLRFLSLCDFTLRYRAGMTKRRLRLLINGSREFDLSVPATVPALLALPDYTRDNPPPVDEHSYWWGGQLWLEGTQAGVRYMDFDIWLVKLLVFKLAPQLERLIMDPELAARVFELNTPPAILASVSTLGIQATAGDSPVGPASVGISMETLLLSFPNLVGFHNHERTLVWHPAPEISDDSPPLGPNLRRLVLASEQPAQLQYVARMLREFPNLESLYFHRKPTKLAGWRDDTFSNASVFDAVHHSLRVLTYTSTSVNYWRGPAGPRVEVDSFEEPNSFHVPHFRDFRVLERLTIDQALLGDMEIPHDHADAPPPGPQFPGLDRKLPESLCTLTIQFVRGWRELAAQLASVAAAKRTGGQFPLLKDIVVVIADHHTVQYTGTWPPEIPLRRSYEPIIVSTGVLLREAGIKLSVSKGEIGPRPADLGTHPDDFETLLPIIYSLHEFPSA